MQYCGAEREATLRESYLNANYQVQNMRQFESELEQHSQVRKLNIVTHLRSESQLDQVERLKGRSTTNRDRVPIQHKLAREGIRARQHACCGVRSWFGHEQAYQVNRLIRGICNALSAIYSQASNGQDLVATLVSFWCK